MQSNSWWSSPQLRNIVTRNTQHTHFIIKACKLQSLSAKEYLGRGNSIICSVSHSLDTAWLTLNTDKVLWHGSWQKKSSWVSLQANIQAPLRKVFQSRNNWDWTEVYYGATILDSDHKSRSPILFLRLKYLWMLANEHSQDTKAKKSSQKNRRQIRTLSLCLQALSETVPVLLVLHRNEQCQQSV